MADWKTQLISLQAQITADEAHITDTQKKINACQQKIVEICRANPQDPATCDHFSIERTRTGGYFCLLCSKMVFMD